MQLYLYNTQLSLKNILLANGPENKANLIYYIRPLYKKVSSSFMLEIGN